MSDINLTQIHRIVTDYIKWSEGKDDDYLYDETIEWLSRLRRAEVLEIMNYLVSRFKPKENL